MVNNLWMSTKSSRGYNKKYYDLIWAHLSRFYWEIWSCAKGHHLLIYSGSDNSTFGAGASFLPISYLFGDILTEVCWSRAFAARYRAWVLWLCYSFLLMSLVVVNLLPVMTMPNANQQAALEQISKRRESWPPCSSRFSLNLPICLCSKWRFLKSRKISGCHNRSDFAAVVDSF